MYRRLNVYAEEARKGRPTATVLQYDPDSDSAPRVVATGQGKVAERILELARENNVPIHDDPQLAAALSLLDVEQEIPPELYRVVAEVLAYIYRVGKLGKKIMEK